MRLKKTFVVNQVGGETIVVPITGDFNGVAKTNDIGGFILECLKEDVSIEEIVDRVFAEYDAPRDKIQADVEKLISQLREIDAIE